MACSYTTLFTIMFITFLFTNCNSSFISTLLSFPYSVSVYPPHSHHNMFTHLPVQYHVHPPPFSFTFLFTHLPIHQHIYLPPYSPTYSPTFLVTNMVTHLPIPQHIHPPPYSSYIHLPPCSQTYSPTSIHQHVYPPLNHPTCFPTSIA